MNFSTIYILKQSGSHFPLHVALPQVRAHSIGYLIDIANNGVEKIVFYT